MKKCTKNGLSAAVTGCYGVIALLFVVILLGGCNAKSTVTPDAAGAVQWKYLYYNGSRQEIEITDSNIDNDHIVVPENIDGAAVTAIGANAFHKKRMSYITLPGTVKVIRSGAFSGCQNLRKIVLPGGVEKIETTAFYNCLSLESIETEASVHFKSENGVLYSKDMTVLVAYPEGKWDREYYLPQSVEKIEAAAFGCRPRLRDIYVLNDNIEFPQAALCTQTDGITLHGSEGSTAQKYAGQWGIAFEAL